MTFPLESMDMAGSSRPSWDRRGGGGGRGEVKDKRKEKKEGGGAFLILLVHKCSLGLCNLLYDGAPTEAVS